MPEAADAPEGSSTGPTGGPYLPGRPEAEQPSASETAVGVRVRFFAGARAAAGVDEQMLRLTPNTAAMSVTVADAVEALRTQHGDRLSTVLPACSFLLDGVAVRDRSTAVRDDAQFDVLPPFAGG